MPITVYEKHGSPDGRFVNPVDGAGSSFTYTYVVLGTGNVTTATGTVAAVAPLFYLADDSQILVRQEFIPKVVGPTSWEIGVRYGTEDDRKSHEVPEAGFWRFSFDTTGGTHKITQSLETIHRVEAEPADPAPDLKQAIGWDGKRVNGVDVVVPKLEFDITAYYAPATITAGYMKDLARKTGRTSKTVRGARRRTVIVSVLESLRQHVSAFTLSNVIDEIRRWSDAGQSCFTKLLKTLNLTPPTNSLLDYLLPEPSD